ncbi:Stealth CR1 domain-containing protein [Weissella cibaria]|uniref:Stealth CR1 domain-containing protein n=1 Tax=Weissella cibaria TaxID=137591 RepID=UPI0013DC43DB|nr:Stealth CR1 domain-containing protein [Weissella cibaria]NFA02557.1 hypothetical protein [Weissella cibaria]
MNSSFDIDFVVTWVNGSDEDWQKKRGFYQKKELPTKEVNDEERYREMGSLENWVKRVIKFAPWVHNVFIVTDNQNIGFDLPDSRFKVVNHTDFIEHSYLPLFNSNSIEINVDLIDGLAEHFVLFNDDFYLTSPVKRTDFFNEKGWPVEVGYMTILHASELFQHITLNNMVYINRFFSKHEVVKNNFWKYFHPIYGLKNIQSAFSLPWSEILGWHDEHLTSAYRKSTFTKVHNLIPELRSIQTSNRFRKYSDVSHLLMKFWQIAEGEFVPRKPDSFGKFVTVSDDDQEHILEALTGDWKVVCINDGKMDYSMAEKANQKLIELLNTTLDA